MAFSQPTPAAAPPLVVVIIGMRGAGKSTLGSKAAQLLGWPFSDLDETITQANNGKLPPQIVEERGWDAFRQLELQAFEEALSSEASTGVAGAARIIACGGGIVETEPGMELLQRHWPVVMVDPFMDDVLQRLEQNAQQAHRAPLNEDLRQIFLRRLPRYRTCADFRFPVAGGDTDQGGLASTLAQQLQRLLTGTASSVHLGPDTFAVALTLPDYAQAPAGLLREASLGADVVELRVDLLASLEHDFVAQQVAIVRKETCCTPLLFTVRSADHGGRFVGPEKEYFALLRLGLALGVELLDVECTWTQESSIDELTSCRHVSLFVGSHFDMAHQMPESEDVYAAFKRCALNGAARVARVVLHGRTREQNLLVQHMGNAAAAPGIAFVGLCAGKEGCLSSLLNQVLCPATHPRLVPADPGHLTIDEVMRCRRTLSLCSTSKHFPVLGPWGSRVLPQLLATALQSAFLGAEEPRPSSSAHSVQDRSEVHRWLSLASVGGAALLGQVQHTVVPLLDELSDDAASVGAVDCVVRGEDGTLLGTSALTQAIQTRLEAVGLREHAKNRVALVLGSGTSGRAALVALKALGYGQVLRASAVSFAEEVQDFPSYTVTLDKSNGDPLGVEISHNHGPMLRVERVTGGLVELWNAANRELEVQAGDCIFAVNGAVGEVAKLVEQCGSNQLLHVKLLRKAVAGVASEPLEDLTILAALSQLDVVIVADLPAEGCSQVKGAQWLVSTLGRFRPVVVDMCWPPRRVATPGSGPDLLAAARAADCSLIEGVELLQEQACACMAVWNGPEALRRRLAKVLHEEVSKAQIA